MIIPLFFSDFRKFVSSERLKGEAEHPAFYWEDEVQIVFYKPYHGMVYTTFLDRMTLPEDMDINNIKQEFQAIEIPRKLDHKISIQGSFL